jgi:periplasmic divalent cation tolerance protein
MSEHAIVLCTVGSESEAAKIAGELVARHLAACVNVLPDVRSTYRWQGEVRTDREWLLVAKTRRDRFDELSRAIHELHSYELPEVVMIDIERGDAAYLAWITASVE